MKIIKKGWNQNHWVGQFFGGIIIQSISASFSVFFFPRYETGMCPLPKPQGQSPIAAFENTLEATTVEQLEEAVSDPDGMRMQALLVRERILGMNKNLSLLNFRDEVKGIWFVLGISMWNRCCSSRDFLLHPISWRRVCGYGQLQPLHSVVDVRPWNATVHAGAAQSHDQQLAPLLCWAL